MTPPRRQAAPFCDRLALARAMIAHGLPTPPVHVADQFQAASADTRELHDQIGAVLPLLEPERNWRHLLDAAPSDEVRAFLLAALLGCQSCCHLRRGGPQPAVVMLPIRRISCQRCVQTLRRPVTGADESDLCTRRGVVMFHPFAVRYGSALIMGDACPACASVLGIRVEEAVS